MQHCEDLHVPGSVTRPTRSWFNSSSFHVAFLLGHPEISIPSTMSEANMQDLHAPDPICHSVMANCVRRAWQANRLIASRGSQQLHQCLLVQAFGFCADSNAAGTMITGCGRIGSRASAAPARPCQHASTALPAERWLIQVSRQVSLASLMLATTLRAVTSTAGSRLVWISHLFICTSTYAHVVHEHDANRRQQGSDAPDVCVATCHMPTCSSSIWCAKPCWVSLAFFPAAQTGLTQTKDSSACLTVETSRISQSNSSQLYNQGDSSHR